METPAAKNKKVRWVDITEQKDAYFRHFTWIIYKSIYQKRFKTQLYRCLVQTCKMQIKKKTNNLTSEETYFINSIALHECTIDTAITIRNFVNSSIDSCIDKGFVDPTEISHRIVKVVGAENSTNAIYTIV